MLEKSSTTKDSKPKAKQNIEWGAGQGGKTDVKQSESEEIFHLSPLPNALAPYEHGIDMYVYAKSLANTMEAS